MGDLVTIPNYRERAVAMLLSQYRTKPRMVALIRAVAAGAQCLEEQAFGLLVSSTLTAALGDALNQWGALVGEPRGALTDSEYRQLILARITANRSRGNADDLIKVFAIAATPYLEIISYDIYPAAFYMQVRRSDPMGDVMASRVGALMRSVKPAGIGLDLVEAVTGRFGFEGNPYAEPLDIGPYSRSL